MKNYLQLCHALNSRLCHEIAGAIGVNDTCLELIESNDEKMKVEAMKLLKQNSINLSKKFKFYRWAYGVFIENELVETKEIEKLISGYALIHNNLNVTYGLDSAPKIDYLLSKIYICLAATVIEALYRGGDIKMSCSGEEVKIIGVGRKVHIEKFKEDILAQKIDLSEIRVQNSHECYTRCLMEHGSYKLYIHAAEDEIIEFILRKADS